MNWNWQGIDLKGAKVTTVPDFAVYERLEVRGFDERENEILLKLQFSPDLGRYYIAELTLIASGEEDEINGARLREIPALTLARTALDEGGMVELASGGVFDLQDVINAAADIVEGGPSSEEAMLATARVYRHAQILERSPAKAVQRALGLTAPTATLWIRRARQLGMLGAFGNTDD